MRDVEADYKAAYLAEHAALVAAGQHIEAAKVAGIVKAEYGEDISEKPADKPKRGPGRPRKETAAATPAPETADNP